MSRLVDAGLIQKTGETRGALFMATPTARHFLTPAYRRPVVAYDPERLGAYVPNVTAWLDPDAARRMHDAAGHEGQRYGAGVYAQRITERFLIDLTWASSNLEGNTYEYLETEVLIKYNQLSDARTSAETTMILNHKAAISFVLEGLGAPDIYTPEIFSRVHALLMSQLLEPSDLGRPRSTGAEVRITGSSYRPSQHRGEVQRDLEMLAWAAREIADPFEASFFILAGCSYLQPFSDGNRRTGRIMASVPLLRANLPPLSFLATDKAAYISGLIAFYELGDTALLSGAIADAYVETASRYQAAVATQRAPRSAEVRHRQLIADMVREAATRLAQDPQADVGDLMKQRRAAHINQGDRDVVVAAVNGGLAALTMENRDVWGVSEDVARTITMTRRTSPDKDTWG